MDLCANVGGGMFTWEKSPRQAVKKLTPRRTVMYKSARNGDPVRMIVTPDIAGGWLEYNNDNRPLRRGQVNALKSDLLGGRWWCSSDAIAFLEDGTLANGQHRLTAISESGVAAECLVLFGMSKEARAVIDGGLNRNVKDGAWAMGFEGVTSSDAPIVRGIICQYSAEKNGRSSWSTEKLSNSLILAWLSSLKDCVDYAKSFAWKRANAGVKTAIACAYLHYGPEKRKRLDRFVAVVSSGDASGGNSDSAALRLREQIMSNTGAGAVYKHDVFLKTCQAIRHFVKEKECRLLRSSVDSAFKIADAIDQIVPESARKGVNGQW